MAEGGNPPPSESAWTRWKSYLRKKAEEYKTKRAIERAQRPPSGWSKSGYPKHLDSLDPFHSKIQGKPIGKAKLVSRPRTPEERAAFKPDADDKRDQMLKLNLTEAVDQMTKITDEIISILDMCLMSETLDKSSILEKLAEAINLTDEIDFIYHETRCGVPSQYHYFNGKLREDLEKARSIRFTQIKEQLLKCYDYLNCLRELHKRTKENARTLERRYMENRQIKQKLRSPRPPKPRRMPLPPYNPLIWRPKRKGPNKGELRRARAIKPKSPLAIEDPSSKETIPPEEECLAPEPTRSSSEEDLGAIASASAKAKQNAMQKAATSAAASIAKFARRREALQAGSNGELTDIGKLSISSPDETESNLDDLYRDSDDDTADEEASDDD